MKTKLNPGEQKLADILKQFGWECGPKFWERYYADPWVFNLANAVERLADEVDKVSDQLEKVMDTISVDYEGMFPEDA